MPQTSKGAHLDAYQWGFSALTTVAILMLLLVLFIPSIRTNSMLPLVPFVVAFATWFVKKVELETLIG